MELHPRQQLIKALHKRAAAKARTEASGLRDVVAAIHDRANPNAQASSVSIVRKLFAQFELPARVGYTAGPARRASAFGAHGMRDGECDVHVHVRPHRGASFTIRVPVTFRQGQVHVPSTGYVGDQMFLIAQSTLDELIEGVACPRDRRQAQYEDGRVPSNEGDDTAPAELDVSDWWRPGDEVALKQELLVDRLGRAKELIKSGTKGTVIREYDGTGREYYVAFDDGQKAVVPASALR